MTFYGLALHEWSYLSATKKKFWKKWQIDHLAKFAVKNEKQWLNDFLQVTQRP